MKTLIGFLFVSPIYLGGAAAEPTFLGSVHSGTYGETVYHPIPDIELRSYPRLVEHPYEVRIPNTSVGDMIVCQLLDSAGAIKATKTGNSGSGETYIYFSEDTPGAAVKCAYVEVERLTRPSTGP